MIIPSLFPGENRSESTFQGALMRVRIFIFLLFISIASAFGQQAEDWYMGKPIREIKFEGLKNV